MNFKLRLIVFRKSVYYIIPFILLAGQLLAQPLVPLERIEKAMENIEVTYLDMGSYFRSKPLRKSPDPYFLAQRKNADLPDRFVFNGSSFSTSKYLDSSYCQGFLVIQNDTIVYENYWRGQKRGSKHISWSMSKSYTSALFGIAMEEGYIKSINERVDTYVPELKGSGYEGVVIKDVLEMSSGIGFDENYSDENSDISRWWNGFMRGESQDKFAASLENETKPGTYNRYVSINTHVLGMVLVRATGKSITKYTQEKLWDPMGAENDAYWLSDAEGMEMVLGGLNASLLDYGKIGQLYLHQGKLRDKQIVPEKWVYNSLNPRDEHLQPYSKNSQYQGFGYGYQWWLPAGEEGEFMAIGVFNQYIYVNPTTKTVIVKNSANVNYDDYNNPYRATGAHLELFRKIAHGLN